MPTLYNYIIIIWLGLESGLVPGLGLKIIHFRGFVFTIFTKSHNAMRWSTKTIKMVPHFVPQRLPSPYNTIQAHSMGFSENSEFEYGKIKLCTPVLHVNFMCKLHVFIFVSNFLYNYSVQGAHDYIQICIQTITHLFVS